MAQKQSGMSLIEAMIALGVLSVGALASAAMLANHHRSARTITAGSQYQESMSLLRLFFETATPQICSDALRGTGGVRPVASWWTGDAVAPVQSVEFDGRTLARVGATGEAFEYQSLDLVELFQGMRVPSDTDGDGNFDVMQFTGQFRLRGLRVGDFLGRAALPEYSVPMVFSVRMNNGELLSCRTVGTALATPPAGPGGPSEQAVCEQTFGGVYDPNQTPRCVLSTLVLAANHAERANLIAAAPADFRSSTGALLPGTVLTQQNFASSRLSTASLTATGIVATEAEIEKLGVSGEAKVRTRLEIGYRQEGRNYGTLALRGRATLNGSELCLENGQNCPVTPLPPTPTPTPPPALVAASYTVPGTYNYVVPAGSSGRLRITVLGAGGSGGCGNTRNGEGGRAGQLIQEEFTVRTQAASQIFSVRVGRSEVACPTVNNNGGTRGRDGESSQFDLIFAGGGRGGLADFPGGPGNDRCYPNAPEGLGEPGPLDTSRAQARPCLCDRGDVPAVQHSQYSTSSNFFPHGCPSTIPGAGGGGGGDNYQGGRGGHGLVIVTPLPL
jgi:hypothetical protein